MRTCFLEGYFDLPAADEPGQNLFRFSGLVGAEECLWCELILRITHQHPAQGHGRHPFVKPDGSASGDLDDLVALAVPLRQCHGTPLGILSSRDGFERWLSRPFTTRSSDRAGCALRRRIIKSGIEPQAGDDTDLAAHRIDQFQRCETAVGDHHDGALGQNGSRQQHLHQRPGTLGKHILQWLA